MAFGRRRAFALGGASQSGTGWGSGNVGLVVESPSDWSIFRDFNSGASGASANGTADGFDGDAGASVYTTEQVYAGARSCKMTITSGSGGFGLWGGRLNFPAVFLKGDTLWYQHYYWMPNGYVISTTPGFLKYLRFRTETSAGANVGYVDLYLNDDVSGTPATTYRWIFEGQQEWVVCGPNRRYLRDQWVRQTVRVDFSDVPAGLGGFGRVRHWENGSLILDSAVTRGVSNNWLRTLENATDKSTFHLLHTYWNNDNAPATQSSYVDDIRIAKNGRPSWTLDLPGAA